MPPRRGRALRDTSPPLRTQRPERQRSAALAGVNASVVEQIAGHASITTTMKHYTQILPSALRASQARLPFGDALSDIPDTYHRPDDGKEGKKGKIVTFFTELS